MKNFENFQSVIDHVSGVTEEGEIRLCIDCLHYNYMGNCDASNGKTEVVLGGIISGSKPAQEMRAQEIYCGAQGKWFKK